MAPGLPPFLNVQPSSASSDQTYLMIPHSRSRAVARATSSASQPAAGSYAPLSMQVAQCPSAPAPHPHGEQSRQMQRCSSVSLVMSVPTPPQRPVSLGIPDIHRRGDRRHAGQTVARSTGAPRDTSRAAGGLRYLTRCSLLPSRALTHATRHSPDRRAAGRVVDGLDVSHSSAAPAQIPNRVGKRGRCRQRRASARAHGRRPSMYSLSASSQPRSQAHRSSPR